MAQLNNNITGKKYVEKEEAKGRIIEGTRKRTQKT